MIFLLTYLAIGMAIAAYDAWDSWESLKCEPLWMIAMAVTILILTWPFYMWEKE